MARTESTMIELGTLAPDFTLPDVISGKSIRLADVAGKKGTLVLFICPHCPYVKHIEQVLGNLSRDYSGQPISMIAICSNDTAAYPQDGPDFMRLQAETHGFQFPYLFDATQEVAKAYQAACTPDFFLFDGNLELAYRGQFDASRPNSGIPVTGADLRAAIDALLAGQPAPKDQRPSLGCNIKWKP